MRTALSDKIETLVCTCPGVAHARAKLGPPGVVDVLIWGADDAFHRPLSRQLAAAATQHTHKLLPLWVRARIEAGPSWGTWTRRAASPHLGAEGARQLLPRWPAYRSVAEVLAVIEEHWPLWLLEDADLARQVDELRHLGAEG